MSLCNCNLCRGLDAKRERALAWLGSRWLLAPQPAPVEVVIDVQAIALDRLAVDGALMSRPRLTLVKS